jgi:hypothetical protein
LAEYAGVGVRVQGLRRYYAVLLVRPDRLRLVRVVDGAVNVLAESAFAWTFETPYAIAVQVSGAKIEASVSGIRLKALDEGQFALANGGVALILQGGACSCDTIDVGPPRGALDPLGVAVSAAVRA